MKLYKIIALIFLISTLNTSCSTDNLDTTPTLDTELYIPEEKLIELEILERVNEHRLSLGLNKLERMAIIKSQAYIHTNYMIHQAKPSHDNFFERQQFLMIEADITSVSENVAYGFSTAEATVNAWLNSESHKVNIEGDHTHFDISAEQADNGKWYFTNIFIKKL